VTKPYISSSNYIRKMSSFGRGDWCDIWDGLFWRFIWGNLECPTWCSQGAYL
jgi:deoxyribodipyrimidine photolyase-related protein